MGPTTLHGTSSAHRLGFQATRLSGNVANWLRRWAEGGNEACFVRWCAASPSLSRKDRDRHRPEEVLRAYEIMIILDPETDERTANATLEKLLQVVPNNGAT